MTMRMIALAAVIAAACGGSAMAFSEDNTSNTAANGAARFSDPDDNVPFPHLSDDGQMQNNSGFQFGNGSATMNANPFSGSSNDAFERAKANQQQ